MGLYFNSAFRMWGTPESSVLRQGDTGNWTVLAPVPGELLVFVVLVNIVL